MSFNIGLNVVEVDGFAAPSIVGAAVSVAAFNVLTQRGVPNTPVRVTSFKQFVERFGGYIPGGFGAYMVKGFFDNTGQRAYINRIVAADATAASITLEDGANDTLTLAAGFRGQQDPGAWANNLFVRVAHSSSASSRLRETAPATITSAVLAPPIDMSALPALSIRVDGEATATAITFAAADFGNATQATLVEIRDAINRHPEASARLIATVQGNQLVLTSSGSIAALDRDWTRLQVTADNATLGFTTMANPVRGTPATLNASGTQLANAGDFSVGDAIRISDGANTAFAKLLRIIPATNSIEWAPAIGTPGNFDGLLTTIRNVEFDLTIANGGTEDTDIVETWSGLSMEPDVANYAPSVVNDALAGSRYLTADDEDSAATVGQDLPAEQAFTRLDPGTEGTATASNFIGDPAQRTGFYAFDPYDVQLLCCERNDPAIVREALGYCARRGDAMFVGAVPEGYVGGGQAIAYGQAFQGKNVYGALYGPWIKVFDPIGTGPAPVKWIPPTGHILGMYARIASVRGVWKAPAGDEAQLAGALDVEYRLSDADHTDLVKSGSVNGVRVIPGAGIIVDASRTLSTDTRWLYVNVRLLFNFVKSSLKAGLRWTRQEPNRDSLWNLIKFNTVTPFLLGLWRQGAFGTGAPDEVFTVICDATNNPQEEVDQGNLRVEVYFYPSKPAETIIIIVGQQPSGATAGEA